MRYYMKYFVISLVVVLFSCSSTKNKIALDKACSIAKTKIEIPDMKDSTVILYSDIFSGIKMIPLESSPDFGLSTISKIYVTNDSNYVIFDDLSGNVAIFNKTGSVIKRIGQKGHRKNEYTTINDVVYDCYNDNVIIWDNPRKKLLIFSTSGKYISDVDVSWWTGAFEILDKDRFVFYVDDINEKEDFRNGERIKYKYKYVVTDRKGKTLKEFCDLHYTLKGFIPTYQKSFRINGERIISHQEYSPVILSFEQDTINYDYAMLFDNNTLSEEWFELNENDFRKKIHEDEDLAYCYDFFEAKSHYITIICQDKLFLNVVSKKTKKNRTGFCAINDLTSMNELDSLKCVPGEILPINVLDDNCYFVQDPSKLQALLNTIKKAMEDNKISIKSQELERLKDLASNKNPILMVCKLK